MFKEKNHVGRPSNDELKTRRNKKILLFGIPVLLIIIVIALVATGSLSNLMGNSVTEYYCEDSSYKLEGNKCVKEIKEKSVMLGDVNLDDKVTNEDLDLISRYINYADFGEQDEEASNLTSLQVKAADVSEDNDVYMSDVDLLERYLGNNSGSIGNNNESIGVKRVCSDGFTLQGIECVKKEIVDAEEKTNSVQTVNNKKDEEAIGSNDNNVQNQTTSISNPVVVTLKPENNANKLKVNTTYKINVNFDIKDNSKQYYYIWTNYLYGEKNYSTECKPVIQGEHSGNFKVIGPRKVNVTVYSDSACQNQVSSTDSAEYACDGCQNMVDVTFKPQDDKTSVPNNTKYKLNVNFDVKDTTKDYYYIWSAYLNGEKNSETKCTKITPGEHGGSLVINGKRIVSLTVYGDSQCKNKIKSFNSKQYVCIDCGKSVDVKLRPQNKKTSFIYGTKYKMDVIFDINDTSKDYYYIWYNFKNGDNNYKTKCTKVTQGAHGGSFTIDGTKKVQVMVYSDSSCRNKIRTVSSETYKCSNCTPLKISVGKNIGTSYNNGTVIHNGVKFNLIDKTSPTYYYLWRTYTNGTNTYTSDCQKVVYGVPLVKDLTINGTRKGTITVYTDNKCKNRLNTVPVADTLTFKCKNCAPLSISIGKNLSSSQTKNTIIHNGIVFNLIDKTSPQYYYVWRTYTDGANTYTSDCQKVVYGTKLVKDLTINGTRRGTITVYTDNKCNYRLNTVPVAETTTYNCSNCNESSSGGGSNWTTYWYSVPSGGGSSGGNSGGSRLGNSQVTYHSYKACFNTETYKSSTKECVKTVRVCPSKLYSNSKMQDLGDHCSEYIKSTNYERGKYNCNHLQGGGWTLNGKYCERTTSKVNKTTTRYANCSSGFKLNSSGRCIAN